jgi:hypothetical protein
LEDDDDAAEKKCMGVNFLKFDVPFDVYRQRGHRIREL